MEKAEEARALDPQLRRTRWVRAVLLGAVILLALVARITGIGFGLRAGPDGAAMVLAARLAVAAAGTLAVVFTYIAGRMLFTNVVAGAAALLLSSEALPAPARNSAFAVVPVPPGVALLFLAGVLAGGRRTGAALLAAASAAAVCVFSPVLLARVPELRGSWVPVSVSIRAVFAPVLALVVAWIVVAAAAVLARRGSASWKIAVVLTALIALGLAREAVERDYWFWQLDTRELAALWMEEFGGSSGPGRSEGPDYELLVLPRVSAPRLSAQAYGASAQEFVLPAFDRLNPTVAIYGRGAAAALRIHAPRGLLESSGLLEPAGIPDSRALLEPGGAVVYAGGQWPGRRVVLASRMGEPDGFWIVAPGEIGSIGVRVTAGSEPCRVSVKTGQGRGVRMALDAGEDRFVAVPLGRSFPWTRGAWRLGFRADGPQGAVASVALGGYEIGMEYLRLGMLKEARDWFAAAAAGGDVEARVWTGVMKKRLGDPEGARAAWDIAGEYFLEGYLALGDETLGGEEWEEQFFDTAGMRWNTYRRAISVRYEAEDLFRQVGSRGKDPEASGGWAVSWKVEDGKKGFAMFGPYHRYEEGPYEARFRVRAAQCSRGDRCGRVDVAMSEGREIAGEDLVCGVNVGEEYGEVVLKFRSTGAAERLEFRVMVDGPGRVWVDSVEVTPDMRAVMKERAAAVAASR